MTRDELFTNLNNGARWDVGVSINRSNSLPLDANSIFRSYEEATAYASKNLTAVNAAREAEGLPALLNNAYIGQLISVVAPAAEGETVGTVGVYYIDQDMKLQEVGAKAVYDGKSVSFNSANEVEVAGFATANAQTLPRKTANGGIEWVPVSSVIEGATVNTITEGDTKSIVTTETTSDEDGNVVGIKLGLGGYSDATVDTVPFKTATGFNWQTVYTKAEVDAKVSAVFLYKGPAKSVSGATITLEDEKTVTASNDNIGWVYQIGEAEYASTGTTWEKLGTTTDLSNYYTKSDADSATCSAITTALANGGNPYVTTSEMSSALGSYTTTEVHCAAIQGVEEDIASINTCIGNITANYATKSEVKEVNDKFSDYSTTSAIAATYATCSAVAGIEEMLCQCIAGVNGKIGDLGDFSTVVEYVQDYVGEGAEVGTEALYKFTTNEKGQVVSATVADGATIRGLNPYSVAEGSILTLSATGEFGIDVSGITGDIGSLCTAISTEVARAQEAEGKLQDAINTKQDALATQEAKASGLYKITTNTLGQVTAATDVSKDDILALGIPAQDTTYTAGTGINIGTDDATISVTDYVATSANLSAEVQRAQEAEGKLQDAINTKQDALATQEAKASGLYKIATNTLGQVTEATDVSKDDILALGIPAKDTTYTNGYGLTLDDTTFAVNTEVIATKESVTAVAGDLGAEVTRATKAETDLQGAINALKGALTGETTIDVTNEETTIETVVALLNKIALALGAEAHA